MPQDFTENPQFSQTLKVNINDKKFSAGFALLYYIDDLLLCCPSQVSSQEGSAYLLELLALKGRKCPKETKTTFLKLRFNV